MPQFLYQAKRGPHQKVQGTLEAGSLDLAIARVMDLGFSPVDVRPAPPSNVLIPTRIANISAVKIPVTFLTRAKVTRTETVFFIQQISDLISAGVPVLRALALTGKQARSVYMKDITTQMGSFIKDGGTLSDAMARYPDVFPRLYSNLVRAGESSGKLSEVLKRLAELAQRDLDTRSQVFASLIYPALVMVVGCATIFALLTCVVPRLTAIFADLNEALPLPTVILLGVSGFLANFWWLVLLAVGGGIYYALQLNSQRDGRLFFDKIKLRLPVVGQLVRSVETGRFARTMATLLGNGVTIVNALESTALVMSNEVLRRDMNRMAFEVRNGASLTTALRKSSIFPESVVTMVAVGEESGQVHQGLERMADYFEREAQRSIKTMTTLIEPLLIFALGLVVGFVVLAMLMPLLRMNTIIR